MYFAAKPANEVTGILLGKAEAWSNLLENNGYLEKIRTMWSAYYGAHVDSLGNSHQITFGGEQGELVNLVVNHFRNIAQHILVMTTSNRPSLECRSVNTDQKSLIQTYLGNGLLDYYMREKDLEVFVKNAVETSIVLGRGFIKLGWDATSGELYEYNEETKTPIYEGDIEFTNLTPFDVFIDTSKESASKHDWKMCRIWKNKWDLAAKYPELADKIKGLKTKSELNRLYIGISAYDETDDVAVFEFYHRRSDSMPDGRLIVFCEEDVVLYDGPLPYREIPIYDMAPSTILGTSFGYSPLFDIFPIQQAIDALYSTVFTNQHTFGVQNIWAPSGSNIVVKNLYGGLNLIEGNIKPEPLNLTQTPPEIFKFIEMLERAAETISAVNSVARGNPESSLRSGNALALVQSMALQFISGLQQSYVQLLEDVGGAVIQMLKDFAATPRVAAIVGKHNRTFLREFKGDDLSSINRVQVNVGNPLARTTAGRVQMAEQLLQMGAITNPKDYINIINTGNIDVMTEDTQNELILVKGENERMLQLQPVQALALDDHKMHIIEHKGIFSDQELRQDPRLVSLVLSHIEEHVKLLRETDPDLLGLVNQQPLAPKQPEQPIPEMLTPPAPGQLPEEVIPQGSERPVNIPTSAQPPTPFQNMPQTSQEQLQTLA